MRGFVWLLGVALMAPCGAWAQGAAASILPDSAARRPAAEDQRRILFKLGTGLTRGFELGSFSGLLVPVVAGAEYSLAPGWSAYANGFTSVRVMRWENSRSSSSSTFLSDPGFDAGIRWYYNQAKRQAKGKRSGPFIGNYLALHTLTQFWSYRSNSDTRYDYGLSAVMLAWGLQRRLGRHGLLDVYAGAGVNNRRSYFYDAQAGSGYFRRKPGLEVEWGVKLSLVR